ncbi:MAG: hypothetical protein R2799_03740 [Crocinitomicaceae bacterium]
MKVFIFFIFISFGTASILSGQNNEPIPRKIKRVDCNHLSENDSKSKQMRCMLIDVVRDSINYLSMEAKKSEIILDTPEKAWNQLGKLYPNFSINDYCCWTEYEGYYVFALNCNGKKKSNKCYFICMLYVPIGGNEFWFFAPRT